MAKSKLAPKSLPALSKAEINQLIEKGLKKVVKRIDSLEKTVEKLKAIKKSLKAVSVKKTKATVATKKRRSKKKAKTIKQDLS
jgi:succinate dehydrogenase/fumarate reductase flavoprotein subunit